MEKATRTIKNNEVVITYRGELYYKGKPCENEKRLFEYLTGKRFSLSDNFC